MLFRGCGVKIFLRLYMYYVNCSLLAVATWKSKKKGNCLNPLARMVAYHSGLNTGFKEGGLKYRLPSVVPWHCVKWGVSWCWNHTIRTRILREYGHTRTYRVPRHATCPPRVRNRIRSDSDLTRVMGNPMSGYVTDTRRVETWKFPYTFRFAANNNVPHTSAWSVSLRLSFRVFLKIVFSTIVRIVSLSVRPEIPRY